MRYSLCKIISLGQNKIGQNTPQTTLQAHFTYSMQKTALKNIKYSKNETILNIDKNGLHPWPISFAK